MLEIILTALYFFLPAFVANMFPVILGALKFPFGQPVSERLFGSHKTWRGFYAGYLGALLILALQKYFLPGEDFPLLAYAHLNIFLYAIPFGLGAIAGDTIKSFFKRRLHRKPGSPFFPWDQLDFVIGTLLSLVPFYLLYPQSFLISPFQPSIILTLLLLTPLLHFLVNLFAYALGLKKVWW